MYEKGHVTTFVNVKMLDSFRLFYATEFQITQNILSPLFCYGLKYFWLAEYIFTIKTISTAGFQFKYKLLYI